MGCQGFIPHFGDPSLASGTQNAVNAVPAKTCVQITEIKSQIGWLEESNQMNQMLDNLKHRLRQ